MSSSEQVELELGQKALVLGGGIRSDDGTNPAHKRHGIYEPLTRRQIWFRVAIIVIAACSCLAVGIGIGVSVSVGESGGGAGAAEVSGVYADAASDPEDYLSFLVVGDWGRRGEHNQTAVAEAMGRCAAVSKPAFVVSVGDNFYEGGLNSLDDPEFKQSFTDVYNHQSLQVPWHAVLGNHDYGDCGYDEEQEHRPRKECPAAADSSRSPSFQLDPSLRRRDWRWYAGRNFEHRPVADVHMCFVDTNPHVSYYSQNRSDLINIPGGLGQQDADAGKDKLKSTLQDSDARWKLVFGHHPMQSNGFWGDVEDVRTALEDIIMQGGAAAYFNGHDHDLQHTPGDIKTVPVNCSGVTTSVERRLHHFTSGAGSKTGRGFGTSSTRFEHDGAGFASVRVSHDRIKVQFWGPALQGAEGLLYSYDIAPPLGC